MSDKSWVVGEFVEAVQLQVVCQTLLNKLAGNATEITKEHLEAYGNIDKALQVFYEDSIREAVEKTKDVEHDGGRGVKEGFLRDWFEKRLITPAETRGLAYRGATHTEGLINAAVDVLDRVHIIREEWRGGARWYELSHDRFIYPIKESNKNWLLQYSSAVQMRRRLQEMAARWAATQNDEDLLDESQLSEAERWMASAEAAELGYDPSISNLVGASRTSIRAKQKQRNLELENAVKEAESARRLRRLVYALGAVSLLALVTATYGLTQQRQAVRNLRLAETNRELAEKERKRAEQLEEGARKERAAAVKARGEADAANAKAVTERELAEAANAAAEAARERAEQEGMKAQAALQIAETARGQAAANAARAKSEEEKSQRNLSLITNFFSGGEATFSDANEVLALYMKSNDTCGQARAYAAIAGLEQKEMISLKLEADDDITFPKYEGALGSSEKALEFYRRCQSSGDRRILAEQGNVYSMIGATHEEFWSGSDKPPEYSEDLLNAYEKALEFYVRAGEEKKAEAMLEEVSELTDRVAPKIAIEHVRSRLAVLENTEPPAGREEKRQGEIAATLAELGDLSLKLERRQEAIDFYRRAKSIFSEQKDSAGLMALVDNFAAADPREALQIYDEILRNVNDPKRPPEADINLKIARIYSGLDQQQATAESHYQRALALYREGAASSEPPYATFRNKRYVRYITGQAEALRGLGDLAFARKETQKSLEYYQQALALLMPLKFVVPMGYGDDASSNYCHAYVLFMSERLRAIGGTLTAIGKVYESAGDGTKAEKHYREAKEYDQEADALICYGGR